MPDKRDVMPWVLIFVGCMGLLIASRPPEVEPAVSVTAVVSISPSKGHAMMFSQLPPLIDPELQNITLPPITISSSPEIPSDIDPTVLANENRNFTLYINDVTVDALYMSQWDWAMEIRLYGHEQGNNTWVEFFMWEISGFDMYYEWEYEILSEDHWIATLGNPLNPQIILKYILWKTHADEYPLWLAIDIRVIGAIELSCDNLGCEYMESLPYQEAVRIVAP